MLAPAQPQFLLVNSNRRACHPVVRNTASSSWLEFLSLAKGEKQSETANCKQQIKSILGGVHRSALCHQYLATQNSFLKQRLSVAEHFRATDVLNVSNTSVSFGGLQFSQVYCHATPRTQNLLGHTKKSRTGVQCNNKTIFISYSNYTVREIEYLTLEIHFGAFSKCHTKTFVQNFLFLKGICQTDFISVLRFQNQFKTCNSALLTNNPAPLALRYHLLVCLVVQ